MSTNYILVTPGATWSDANLYCYKTESMTAKPTEIIDVTSSASIIANNTNQFTLYDPSGNQNKHRQFKSADNSIITSWVEILTPIIKTKNGKLTNEDLPKYIHKVDQQTITCRNMKTLDTKDTSKCPIYSAIMENHIFLF